MTVTTWADKRNRGPGLVDSGWVFVADQIRQDTTYTLIPTMDAADIADPTLSVHFTLESSQDGVTRDRYLRTETWTFGTLDRRPGHTTEYIPATFMYQSGMTPPVYLKVTADLPRQVSIGLNVSLV